MNLKKRQKPEATRLPSPSCLTPRHLPSPDISSPLLALDHYFFLLFCFPFLLFPPTYLSWHCFMSCQSFIHYRFVCTSVHIYIFKMHELILSHKKKLLRGRIINTKWDIQLFFKASNSSVGHHMR